MFLFLFCKSSSVVMFSRAKAIFWIYFWPNCQFQESCGSHYSQKGTKKAWFWQKRPLFCQKFIKIGLFMQNFVIFTKKIPINVIIQTNCSLNLIKTGLQPNKKDIFIKKVILGYFYSKKYTWKYHFFGIKCALRFAGFARKGSYFIFRETT